jgi:hypothetical protein
MRQSPLPRTIASPPCKGLHAAQATESRAFGIRPLPGETLGFTAVADFTNPTTHAVATRQLRRQAA